jgi:hypothetical protein
MDWPLAIARNRAALLAVVAAIVAMLGGREGGLVARHLRNAALSLLRPAESAARRLIVIAARGLSAKPRPAPVWRIAADAAPGPHDAGAPRRRRAPAFRLFDRAKRFRPLLRPLKPAGIPRIRAFWGPAAPPTAPIVASPAAARRPADPDAPVDITLLRLRLGALERALSDLPHQARRLARWRARRKPGQGGSHSGSPGSPLRLGHPPGHRARSGRDIDRVLRDCHLLALDALASDTS